MRLWRTNLGVVETLTDSGCGGRICESSAIPETGISSATTAKLQRLFAYTFLARVPIRLKILTVFGGGEGTADRVDAAHDAGSYARRRPRCSVGRGGGSPMRQERTARSSPAASSPGARWAFRLLRAWPRAALLARLGNASALLPRGLHLTPVPWRLPLYVVRATETQAVSKRRGETEDHVAEALDLLIDDDTLGLFRDDAEFLAAYEYPE